jgi:hypothetical protein
MTRRPKLTRAGAARFAGVATEFCPPVRTEGQVFLDRLARRPRTFDSRFAQISTRLGLGAQLSRAELELLHQAAYLATLCNIALNGLGGCGGFIKLEREANRTRLEMHFLMARDLFYASAGWQRLDQCRRGAIGRIFLTVFVTDDNLAW